MKANDFDPNMMIDEDTPLIISLISDHNIEEVRKLLLHPKFTLLTTENQNISGQVFQYLFLNDKNSLPSLYQCQGFNPNVKIHDNRDIIERICYQTNPEVILAFLQACGSSINFTQESSKQITTFALIGKYWDMFKYLLPNNTFVFDRSNPKTSAEILLNIFDMNLLDSNEVDKFARHFVEDVDIILNYLYLEPARKMLKIPAIFDGVHDALIKKMHVILNESAKKNWKIFNLNDVTFNLNQVINPLIIFLSDNKNNPNISINNKINDKHFGEYFTFNSTKHYSLEELTRYKKLISEIHKWLFSNGYIPAANELQPENKQNIDIKIVALDNHGAGSDDKGIEALNDPDILQKSFYICKVRELLNYPNAQKLEKEFKNFKTKIITLAKYLEIGEKSKLEWHEIAGLESKVPNQNIFNKIANSDNQILKQLLELSKIAKYEIFREYFAKGEKEYGTCIGDLQIQISKKFHDDNNIHGAKNKLAAYEIVKWVYGLLSYEYITDSIPYKQVNTSGSIPKIQGWEQNQRGIKISEIIGLTHMLHKQILNTDGHSNILLKLIEYICESSMTYGSILQMSCIYGCYNRITQALAIENIMNEYQHYITTDKSKVNIGNVEAIVSHIVENLKQTAVTNKEIEKFLLLSDKHSDVYTSQANHWVIAKIENRVPDSTMSIINIAVQKAIKMILSEDRMPSKSEMLLIIQGISKHPSIVAKRQEYSDTILSTKDINLQTLIVQDSDIENKLNKVLEHLKDEILSYHKAQIILKDNSSIDDVSKNLGIKYQNAQNTLEDIKLLESKKINKQDIEQQIEQVLNNPMRKMQLQAKLFSEKDAQKLEQLRLKEEDAKLIIKSQEHQKAYELYQAMEFRGPPKYDSDNSVIQYIELQYMTKKLIQLHYEEILRNDNSKYGSNAEVKTIALTFLQMLSTHTIIKDHEANHYIQEQLSSVNATLNIKSAKAALNFLKDIVEETHKKPSSPEQNEYFKINLQNIDKSILFTSVKSVYQSSGDNDAKLFISCIKHLCPETQAIQMEELIGDINIL